MKAAGLASFTDFKGHLENFRTNGHLLCPQTTSNNADSVINLAVPDVVNGSSSASKSSEGVHSYVSAAFDEDYEVNDEEEVKTPRMSPTLDEIKKKLTHWKPSCKPLYPAVDPTRPDSTGCTPRSLVDAFHKQCPYPLDKLYDESIPVQSRRSIKDNIRLNVEKCAMVDKVALSGRAFTNHSSTIRRLESILTCPSSPLPRLTSYSSSSGSLIGNLSGLSLQPDELVMGDAIFSPLPPPATVKTFLKDSEVDPAKIEPSSVLSSVSSDLVTNGTYEKLLESIGRSKVDLQTTKVLPQPQKGARKGLCEQLVPLRWGSPGSANIRILKRFSAFCCQFHQPYLIRLMTSIFIPSGLSPIRMRHSF
ncbi:hypothetical protein PHET_09599 [Paragonimus heterotremus]|uniref:Uncharacterized protein n=1 Tax=Paragonimus heterotremus TaxID=100268 RepID=A0A8J4WU51_9TREM|nr:hypothetical protein PHET_09599 [Paragonimus heterotremus]